MSARRAWRRAVPWCAVLALGAAVACVSAPAGAEDTRQISSTVAAADRTLELEVPAAALPDGVSASDLSITALAPFEAVDLFAAEAAEQAATAREIARFDLQPSGLRFEQPVAVSARLPISAVTGPLFAYLVTDDGGVEVLSVSIEAIEGESVVATTTVEHFSEIVWSVIGFREFEGMVNAEFKTSSEDPWIGESLEVEVILERLQGEQTVELELIGRSRGGIRPITALVPYTVDVGDGPWQLRGVFASYEDPYSFDGNVLSPAFDPQPPGEWVSTTGNTLTATGSFQCTDAGEWSLSFGGALQLTYEAWPAGTLEGAELPTFEAGNHIQILQPLWATGRCVAPVEPPVINTENSPPSVSPITAVLNAPTTIYSVSASDPERHALTYAWSGANCGTSFGETSLFYVWVHEGEDCDHTTTAHPDAAIAVTVSDGVWKITCTYQGAASGTGEVCTPAGR